MSIILRSSVALNLTVQNNFGFKCKLATAVGMDVVCLV